GQRQHGDVLGQGKSVAAEREPSRVEGARHERSLAQEEEMPGRIFRLGQGMHEDLLRPAVERTDDDGVTLDRSAFRAGEIEEMTAVRQEAGRAVRVVPSLLV